MSKNHLLRVFLDTNMGNQHDGLRLLAAKEKVHLATLDPGEFVCFVNRKRDRVKLFGPNNCFAYYRSISGRIDFNVIANLPRHFDGKKLAYDAALEEVLKEKVK